MLQHRFDKAEWKEQAAGYGALLAAIALFSTIEVASKKLGTGLPPILMAVLRFSITGLILLLPAVKTLRLRKDPLALTDFKNLLWMGSIGVALSIGLYHLAITHMQANAAAILFSANPVFVILFSPFLLKERPSWKNGAAVALGLVGIAFFFRHSGAGRQSATGVLLMLGAEIAFALYTVLSKKFMPRYGAIVITCFAGLIGSAILLPLSLLFEGNPLPYLLHCSWPGILYLAVFATAIGYLAFFFGVVTVGASRGSLFFFLKPLLASLFAWVILGERLTPDLLTGGVFILLALIFVIWPLSNRLISPE
ncbi:MAG: hypothetical protein A2X46_00015 [Lentisphaerae bacterium GWF2_57_35]|nr:MAG: hypothetical protein A2X46_00015 [Lentisphaerae bacterium GWF2_57_35]